MTPEQAVGIVYGMTPEIVGHSRMADEPEAEQATAPASVAARPGHIYYWSGITRSGGSRSGAALIDDLEGWTKARFDRRWQRLTVMHGGEKVASIGRSDMSGRRVWWARVLS